MTAWRSLHHHTYVQYVRVELDSPNFNYEFLNGDICPMPRESEDHTALAAEVVRVLAAQGCDIHTSALKIHVEGANVTTFPDASVIYGELQQYPLATRATALNPIVLAEVTSNWSEKYDTEVKLELYRTIPTLRDYIIVSHRERRITVHSRGDGVEWTAHVANAGERVAVPSVRAELVVDDIYLKTSIP